MGPGYATEVWISEKAAKALEKFKKRDRQMVARILQGVEHWAKAGFWDYEGDKGKPVRHEGHEVYRVAYRASLFRLIGFYETDDKTAFIGIDTFVKGGQELSAAQKDRIKEVASVRDKQEWRRKRRDESDDT